MIYNDLLKREAEGKPIQVGVSGAGWIGRVFVHQVTLMKGMVVRVLADTDTKAACPKKNLKTDASDPTMDGLNTGKNIVSS